MGIIKAVWKNPHNSEIALVTDIGAIPFIDEGDEKNQQLIDDFNNGVQALDNGRQKWSVLDESELSEFVNVSNQYWL